MPQVEIVQQPMTLLPYLELLVLRFAAMSIAFITCRYMQTLNVSITVVSLQCSIAGAPFSWICEMERVVLLQVGATRSMMAHVMHMI